MNKAELIAAMAAKTGETKKAAEGAGKCFHRNHNRRT